MALVAERSVIDHAYERGIPRLFAVEAEYRIAMREAELAFTRQLAEAIRSGSLDGLAMWQGYHAEPDRPAKRLREAGA